MIWKGNAVAAFTGIKTYAGCCRGEARKEARAVAVAGRGQGRGDGGADCTIVPPAAAPLTGARIQAPCFSRPLQSVAMLASAAASMSAPAVASSSPAPPTKCWRLQGMAASAAAPGRPARSRRERAAALPPDVFPKAQVVPCFYLCLQMFDPFCTRIACGHSNPGCSKSCGARETQLEEMTKKCVT